MIKTKKIIQNDLEIANFFGSSKYVLNMRTLLTILTKINIIAGKSTKKNTGPPESPERLFKTPIVTKKRNKITRIIEEANNDFEFCLSHPFLNKIADISKPTLVNIEINNTVAVMADSKWLSNVASRKPKVYPANVNKFPSNKEDMRTIIETNISLLKINNKDDFSPFCLLSLLNLDKPKKKKIKATQKDETINNK